MISELSYIHPDTKISVNVKIDPFTVIHNDVEIGEGTWIGSNVTIFPGARIGKNCKIFPGAIIAAIPQDLKFQGEYTLAVIGDNTTIRECVTVNRGTSDRNKTIVGANCLLMAYVHVAHDCIIGDYSILANSVQLAGHVVVGEHTIIGGLSAVHQFVTIGSHVMISGGSLVRKDVPPFVKAAREPLCFAGINSIGLRRRGFTDSQINNIQDIYRLIYLSGFNNSAAMDKIDMEFEPTAERDLVSRFVRSSERGIIKSGNLKNQE